MIHGSERHNSEKVASRSEKEAREDEEEATCG
jgi:hypothetical protein